MSKIRVLPEILANKIAAGEIVERPASVVKELTENSIDAGSKSIQVIVEAGGKKLISVRDDGEGMSQDDAILAFEHHATSKLRSAEDLLAISTLGFRGEALPSIASISRLHLRTRPPTADDSVAGTELEIQGGTLRGVKPIPWDRGTEVTVRDLFFNLPARRKFLRSHQTESGHITRLVSQYAIVHPEIRYKLESDGRTLIDVFPVATVRERLYQVFGGNFLDNLVEFSGSSGTVRVHGFCSLPHEQRTNSYSQFFFVNRRSVRDKVITSAIRQAYRNCMPASAYPVIQLFLELPYDQVDVNAHPAKTEIRFRQHALVHDLIRDSVEHALAQRKSLPVYEHRGSVAAGFGSGNAGQVIAPLPSARHGHYLSFSPPGPADNPFQRAFDIQSYSASTSISGDIESHQHLQMLPDMLIDAPADQAASFHPQEVRILGQIHESYIVAADSHGLLIIDQHVAHERILYEKLASSVKRNELEKQGLLVPITVELLPHQVDTLRGAMVELGRNGFEVEPFGGNSVLVRTVPAMAKSADIAELLPEILDCLEREDRTLDVERIRDRIAVSTACRAAVKVHMPLAMEKMQWLIDELGRVRVPTNCPHGRPIILRFSLYEIERNFERI
jgi:DNA mismatch repair protein MutL